MMERLKKKSKLIFLLLASLLVSPLRVSAAGADLQKELTISASSEKDYIKQAEEVFALEIKEDGKTYQRTEIRYEVVEIDYLDKKEKVVELEEEPTESYVENGVTYTLETTEKEEKVIREAASQKVTGSDVYDTYVTAADVPATKTVTVKNQVTGAQESVVCSLTGITPAGVATVERVMTVTFSNYDAAYYEWNGNYIARNDEIPPLAGYEDQLLIEAGAAEGSEITGYYYTGEPYTADGTVYRDAAATVKEQIQKYRANYAGTISTPEETKTVYRATYSAPDTEGDVKLAVKAVADYEQVSGLTYNIVLTAVIILGILALLFLLLYLFAKRKKKREEQSGV